VACEDSRTRILGSGLQSSGHLSPGGCSRILSRGDSKGGLRTLRSRILGLIVNVAGGPFPGQAVGDPRRPADPDKASSFVDIRVADPTCYELWNGRGAEFISRAPKEK